MNAVRARAAAAVAVTLPLALLVPSSSASDRIVSRTVPVPGNDTALQFCLNGVHGLCQDTVINQASSVTLTVSGAYAGGHFDREQTQSTDATDSSTYCKHDGFIIAYTGSGGYVDADVEGSGEAAGVAAVNALLQPQPLGDRAVNRLKVCIP